MGAALHAAPIETADQSASVSTNESMSTGAEQLEQARQAIQTGKKGAARQLLAQLLRKEPRNVEAWLLLSSAVQDPAQKQECLRRVLALDPNNAAAKAGLQWQDHALSRPAIQTRPMPVLPPPNPPRLERAEQRARQIGQRNVMIAGAMVVSLLCALVLLIATLVRIVPPARARLEPTLEPVLYTARLWRPGCSESEGIPLWATAGEGNTKSRPVGELAHGTMVSVLAEQWSESEQLTYLQVRAHGLTGWVPDSLIEK